MSVSQAKYERLIDDLRAEFRPQRAWGEGRGIFMVIGHFVVGVAAGAWLFALFYESRAGLTLALVLAALGGLAHLINLGHPGRFWRMASCFRTSWVARGFWGLTLFLPGALLYLVALWWPQLWTTGSVVGAIGYALALVGMVLLMGYMGFVYSSSKAIPFWNSPLHPALYVAYALRGGIAGLLLVQAFGAGSTASFGELLLWWLAVTAVVVVFFALELHGAWTGGNAAARRSVKDLLAGRMALSFYGGTLALGLVVPAWFVWAGLSGETTLQAMAALALASALGDFFMKYSTIRAGVHLPVWTRLTARR
jgi:formate-dependent nitrite reductase membrane component NrfD